MLGLLIIQTNHITRYVLDSQAMSSSKVLQKIPLTAESELEVSVQTFQAKGWQHLHDTRRTQILDGCATCTPFSHGPVHITLIVLTAFGFAGTMCK